MADEIYGKFTKICFQKLTGGIDGSIKSNTLQNNVFECEWFLSRGAQPFRYSSG